MEKRSSWCFILQGEDGVRNGVMDGVRNGVTDGVTRALQELSALPVQKAQTQADIMS